MNSLCPLCHSRFEGLHPATPEPLSTADCRSNYDALRRRERTDLRRMRSHALTVDAWAAQHPDPSVEGWEQRIGVHLVSLYAQLVLGCSYREAKRIRYQAAHNIEFRELPLPDLPAALGVDHALAARSAGQHCRQVEEWARSVWRAWHPHHDQVMSWARRLVAHGRVSEPPRERRSGWYAEARNAVHPTAGRPVTESPVTES